MAKLPRIPERWKDELAGDPESVTVEARRPLPTARRGRRKPILAILKKEAGWPSRKRPCMAGLKFTGTVRSSLPSMQAHSLIMF